MLDTGLYLRRDPSTSETVNQNHQHLSYLFAFVNNYNNEHSSCELLDPVGWSEQRNKFHKKPPDHCVGALCAWLDPISSLEHNHNRYTATAFSHPHEFASI